MIRRTARAVLLDKDDRIFLMKIETADVHDEGVAPEMRAFWITPGGAVEDGEDDEATLRRELREELELGDGDVAIDGLLWHGAHDVRWKGAPVSLNENFYRVRTHKTDLALVIDNAEERAVYRDAAWFTAEELKALCDVVLPRDIRVLIDDAIAMRPAATPIDVSAPAALWDAPQACIAQTGDGA